MNFEAEASSSSQVPAVECLAPPLRVNAKQFAAWMTVMMEQPEA